MKYIFLLIVSVIFLTACSVQEVCVDDDVCSLNEKFIGNCNDCIVDFAVDRNTIWYDYELVDNQANVIAYACVDATNEYDGDVLIEWKYDSYYDSEDKDYIDSVYIDPMEADGSFFFDVSRGSIDSALRFDMNLDSESTYCFNHVFEDIVPSNWVALSFEINSDEAVVEKDYENNYYRINIEQDVESYPDYLLEYDIGDFEYISSRIGCYYCYGFIEYQADYEGNNRWASANVQIYEDMNYFNELKERIYSDYNVILRTETGDIYVRNSSDSYWNEWMWFTDSQIIEVYGRNIEELARAYVDQYMPTQRITQSFSISDFADLYADEDLRVCYDSQDNWYCQYFLRSYEVEDETYVIQAEDTESIEEDEISVVYLGNKSTSHYLNVTLFDNDDVKDHFTLEVRLERPDDEEMMYVVTDSSFDWTQDRFDEEYITLDNYYIEFYDNYEIDFYEIIPLNIIEE